VGFGHEVSASAGVHVPPALPELQTEFDAEGIKEQEDPTLEMEKAAEEARRENEEEKAESEGGEREGESEEEED
jgi:hypothetical protein